MVLQGKVETAFTNRTLRTDLLGFSDQKIPGAASLSPFGEEQLGALLSAESLVDLVLCEVACDENFAPGHELVGWTLVVLCLDRLVALTVALALGTTVRDESVLESSFAVDLEALVRPQNPIADERHLLAVVHGLVGLDVDVLLLHDGAVVVDDLTLDLDGAAAPLSNLIDVARGDPSALDVERLPLEVLDDEGLIVRLRHGVRRRGLGLLWHISSF